MRFAFSPEDEAFRAELKEFYRRELPPNWYGVGYEAESEHEVIGGLKKKLAAKGWLTMSWPKDYYGQDAPATRQMIFAEESAYYRVGAVRDSGVGYLGPAIILHGTPEQKKRFLEPISRGELEFHQGFSEPDAGSDLAGLTTRADRDGDDYVIKGQKIWGGNLRHSQYSFLLARTDQTAPKHKGISFLVIPSDTPGLKYEEFGNLAGGTQNVVYYDNCRVPINECLVGQENRGWYIATTVLNFERAVVEYSGAGRRYLEDIVAWWREQGRCKASDGVSRLLRHKLAQVAVEIEVCRMLAYRLVWLQSLGQVPTYESSEFKIFGSEMTQRFSQVAMSVAGLAAQISRESPPTKRRPLDGRPDHFYRAAPQYTLIGGASEIQRNLIAARGLGLPRE